MSKTKLLALLLFISFNGFSQTINWSRLQKADRHIVNMNAGLEYSLVAGIGYGYQLKTKIPIVLIADFSMPFGENLLDDHKAKLGATFKLAQVGNFHFTGKIQGVFRRYESDFVRMVNFGSDQSAIAGYYKKKWFVAGEVGFDKAIVTNFKHAQLYKDVYPNVQDGWYEPATGGNFYVGLQSGVSFKQSDLTLRLGKVVTEDFKTTPGIPFYFQLGYSFRYGAKK